MATSKVLNWAKEYGWRHLIALIFTTFAVYPILFVATNSVADFANLTNSKLIPDGFTLKHYKLLSNDPLVPYYKWLFNTYKVAIIAGFFNVFLGTLAAYAFSRLKFKGRRASLLTLVIVQMFPSFLAFVAIYLLFFQISDVAPFMGLGTHIGLILVYLGGSIGFNSWLIKGFMDTISPSLDEAAKVDGASSWQIFIKITVPMLYPFIGLALLFRSIDAFKTFDIIYVLTSGGPGILTRTLNLYAFKHGIEFLSMGYAGSIAIVMLIITIVVAQIFLRKNKLLTPKETLKQ